MSAPPTRTRGRPSEASRKQAVATRPAICGHRRSNSLAARHGDAHDVPSAARGVARTDPLPMLLKPEEVADLLRTTRPAIYAMAERGQLPGVVRIGRRLLVETAALLDWLRQNRAPSR